ncbi:hypothetical protein C7386_10354 [Agathobaculum butyriciproducens]|uniref:hypothetical protein n=2 Tax=Bacillota TaxID=1239 RepID=UPI000D5F77D1|nr:MULTISPECIES: hypothetical protein [Butyricicoccus]MBT9817458.1 hypothetical protein [Butyricicoccus faecihominis]PVY47124.1 hypothetical protein C7386_10354 [Agathobaculum butyriciproducens]
MSEMYFKSILIADIVSHKARFQQFQKGLNVITSTNNHVGKSSLLKSLYHTLGANVKYDSVWNVNNKLFVLDFCVDNIDYRIVRQIKSFAVFKGEELILVTSKVMSELAPLLEKIFHFGIYLDSKKDGRVTLAPPVFTFLPYYIDQDNGWSELYGSFQNQEQYKKHDRMKSLYYHLSIYTKSAVELMAQRDKLQEELDTLKTDATKLLDIIEALTDEIQGIVPADDVAQFDKNIQISKNKIRTLVKQIGEKRNRIQELEISLEQHEHQLQVITEYHTIAKTAQSNQEIFTHSCPRCGYLYDDEIYNRVHANYLNVSDSYVKTYIGQVIISIRDDLQKEKQQYITLTKKLNNLETAYSNKEDEFDLYIRHRGISESVDKLNTRLGKNQKEQSDIRKALKDIAKELKSFPSKKEVESKYIEFTRLNIIKLGAWNAAYDGTIKLLSPIKAQGTLENKIILSQFVGLFQTMEYFKTQTIRLPFVVDSPRGKEASQESSKEILSMIAGISMLPQVILATIDFNDYKDSLGDSAKNATVITLQKHNRLLDEADYITHEAEIEQLLNLFNVCKE